MQIFISHVNQDSDLASLLASQLTQSGLNVWNPDEAIEPGDNWATKLGQALGESDVMVVLYTRAARNSDTIRRDVEYALTSRNYRQRLIPVLIDFVTFEAGKGVPWILLKLDPIYVASTGDAVDFGPVIQRAQEIAQRDFNAAR